MAGPGIITKAGAQPSPARATSPAVASKATESADRLAPAVPIKITPMVASIALDALSTRAAAEERTIKNALYRLQKGDESAEAIAEAAHGRLMRLVEQMDKVESSIGKGAENKAAIQGFLKTGEAAPVKRPAAPPPPKRLTHREVGKVAFRHDAAVSRYEKARAEHAASDPEVRRLMAERDAIRAEAAKARYMLTPAQSQRMAANQAALAARQATAAETFARERPAAARLLQRAAERRDLAMTAARRREKVLKARESKSVRDMLPGAKRPLTASAAA
jgi:hypothetical protein